MIIRFDRHENMTPETFTMVMELLKEDINIRLKNRLYGLFDGYYYKDKLSEDVSDLEILGDNKSVELLTNIIKDVESYKEEDLINA
jgi:hypothetical protein